MTTLLTKRELADRLQLSTRTIDRHVRAGLLPFRLAGSRRRFDPAEVVAFLDFVLVESRG